MDKDEVISIRTKLGMTQEGFAYALGTTVNTVNRWENGHNKPSKIWIRQIKHVRDTWK